CDSTLWLVLLWPLVRLATFALVDGSPEHKSNLFRKSPVPYRHVAHVQKTVLARQFSMEASRFSQHVHAPQQIVFGSPKCYKGRAKSGKALARDTTFCTDIFGSLETTWR
ncbi:hypothetical protein M8C21_026897, partial [Ambrosia artemisiifolia]